MSRTLTPRVLQTALVVVPLLAVAAWFSAGADHDRPFAEPDLAAPENQGLASRTHTVSGTVRLSGEVSTRLGRVRAQCLDAQGFPHARRALEIRRPALGTQRRRPLAVSLMDLGPTTRAEARRFGFGGAELAFDEGDRGVLISRSRAFDAAADACDQWIYARLSPGLSRVQSRAAGFQDEVERFYVTELSKAITPILAERVRCLRAAGHPRLTVREFLAADTMRGILEAAGVRPGSHRPPQGAAPAPADVAPGEVGVFPPQIPGTYVPSPAETRFALAYADCAASTSFVERIEAASRLSRGRTVRRFAPGARQLGPVLERHLRQLARPEWH